jgi:hypothetical protein
LDVERSVGNTIPAVSKRGEELREGLVGEYSSHVLPKDISWAKFPNKADELKGE